MQEDRGSGTEVAPAIGFSYSVQVGDGRSLVAQTHVPQDWPVAKMNGLIDSLRDVADRQVAFGKIEALQHEVELKERVIKQLEDGIASVDAKVETLQRNGSITGAGRGAHQKAAGVDMEKEAQQRKNAVVSLQHEMKSRAEIQQRISEMRESLG